MTAVGAADRRRPSRPARRGGYLAAIIVNGIVLWLAHNLAWDLLPFLTGDFTQVLPLITLSIIVSIAANVAYLGYDPAWFRAFGDALTSAVSLLATLRLLTVFPFEFPSGTWDTATRLILALVVLGTGIAVVVNLVKGVAGLVRST